MKLADERLFDQLRRHEADPERNKRKEFRAAPEIESLKNLDANEAIRDFLRDYELDEFRAAGGSGLIIRVKYTKHNVMCTLKVPRAALLSPTASEEILLDEEDPEVDALRKLSHQNIVRFFDSYEIKKARQLLISEWIESSDELQIHIKKRCEAVAATQSNTEIAQSLHRLAHVLHQAAGALHYMHERASLYHFDVKPANILVTEEDGKAKAYVIDLGLARDKTKYRLGDEIRVGFTWEYAHRKDLQMNDRSVISRTKDKSKSFVLYEALDSRYDLYAFGKTIQECLKIIRDFFGERATANYTYSYLHFLACLCLDGAGDKLQRTGEEERFVEDIAGGCGIEIFIEHKFVRMSQVVLALDRLLGFCSIELEIPELNPWYANTINASDIAQANLTNRVRRLITHPLFKRLEREPQLGMLQEVFPTATHTRGNHSLGVYATTCRYINALYWDPENPTCRILLTPERIKTLIVASLLHDLGQTAFGHDIEELDKDLFSHSAFTLDLLTLDARIKKKADGETTEATKVSDTNASAPITLSLAIEDKEPDGWGLSVDSVIAFIKNDLSTPIDYLLSQILDGPIDADKLDYLVRDSVDCRVQYGHGIDVTRLLRSLTSVFVQKGKKLPAHLELGIWAKGRASADAFMLARAQMYKALYWHHTFRAIKAMFLTAAALAMEHLRPKFSSDKQLKSAIRDAYFQHVYLAPVGLNNEGLPGISILPMSGEPLRIIGGALADRSLDFFYQIGPETSKEILKSLVNRRLYKRLDEVPLIDAEAGKLAERLRDPNVRLNLTSRLESEFRTTIDKAIDSPSKSQYHFPTGSGQKKLREHWFPKATFLIDAPLRALDEILKAPRSIMDFKRKYLRTERNDAETPPTLLWETNMQGLMKECAFLRVFVKEEIHDLILSHVKEKDRDAALRRALFG